MRKMSVVKEKRGDWDVIRLGGAINEEASAQLIRIAQETGGRCVFNFRDIVMVTSTGIRAWVIFLKRFQDGRQVEMEECATVVVDQMNMLPSFVQKAKIRSVFVPFECTGCGHLQTQLVEEQEFPAEGDSLSPSRCKRCHGVARAPDELDYFAFRQFAA